MREKQAAASNIDFWHKLSSHRGSSKAFGVPLSLTTFQFYTEMQTMSLGNTVKHLKVLLWRELSVGCEGWFLSDKKVPDLKCSCLPTHLRDFWGRFYAYFSPKGKIPLCSVESSNTETLLTDHKVHVYILAAFA